MTQKPQDKEPSPPFPEQKIIASGSQAGTAGSGPLPAYSATTGAIHMLTKTLSQMLLERDIRVPPPATNPRTGSGR